jgi:hypothetical protein
MSAVGDHVRLSCTIHLAECSRQGRIVHETLVLVSRRSNSNRRHEALITLAR